MARRLPIQNHPHFLKRKKTEQILKQKTKSRKSPLGCLAIPFPSLLTHIMRCQKMTAREVSEDAARLPHQIAEKIGYYGTFFSASHIQLNISFI
jgi:hypothetical protein